MINAQIAKYTKFGAVALGVTSLVFLSGCDKDSTPELTENQIETAVEKYLEENKEDMNTKIAEAEVKNAAEKYFQQDSIALGGQIIKAVNAFQLDQKKQAESGKLETAKTVPDIKEDEYVLGNKNADIVLFEYSDYHCPFCKKFHPTTHQLVEKDPNLAVVLRAMPLVHANTSTPMHEIAECIGKNSGSESFWKFSDLIFEKGDAVTVNNYKKELEILKISNIDKITACYEKGEMKDRVKDYLAEGKKLGINGTPNSIIKNVKTGEVRVVNGAYPIDAVESLIKELRK